MAKKRLGELLVEAGLMTDEQLRAALAEQRYKQQPLGRVLISLGLVSEVNLVTLLSRQLNLPAASLDKNRPTPEALDLLDYEFCKRHCCIPFAYKPEGRFLDVALADPTNPAIFDEIRVKTRCNVHPYLAGPKAIDTAIRESYGRSLSGTYAAIAAATGNVIAPLPGENIFAPDDGGHQEDRSSALVIDRPPSPEDDDGIDIDVADSRPDSIHVGDVLTAPLDFGPQNDARREQHQRALQEELRLELQELRAMIERDEFVLRQLLALVVEKGICSQEELSDRLNPDEE
jgi:hypothetical protein